MKADGFYKTETIDGVLIVTVRSKFFDSTSEGSSEPVYQKGRIADFRERMEGVDQPRVIDLTEIGIVDRGTA